VYSARGGGGGVGSPKMAFGFICGVSIYRECVDVRRKKGVASVRRVSLDIGV
jgi:hypothetical protein